MLRRNPNFQKVVIDNKMFEYHIIDFLKTLLFLSIFLYNFLKFLFFHFGCLYFVFICLCIIFEDHFLFYFYFSLISYDYFSPFFLSWIPVLVSYFFVKRIYVYFIIFSHFFQYLFLLRFLPDVNIYQGNFCIFSTFLIFIK